MNPRHLRSLLGVELRRIRKNLLSALAVAGVGALLRAVGLVETKTSVWLVVAAAMLLGMAVPLNILKDKLTGHLEFTTTLPISSNTLAVAAFLATGLGLVPLSAVATGAINWVVLPALGIGSGIWWVLGTVLAVWAVFSAGAFLLLGTLVRFDLNKVGVMPFALFLLMGLFGDTIQEWIAPHAPAIVNFLASNPALAGVLATTALLLLAASPFAVGFFLIRQGFEKFRPKPDAIDW